MNTTEINEENLKEAGWKKIGNAWYFNKKGITNSNDKWQKWVEGQEVEIKMMDEL